MFSYILIFLLFLLSLAGVNAISIPGVSLSVGLSVLVLLPAYAIRRPLFKDISFLGIAALISGWAVLGFLQGKSVLNAIAIVGLLVVVPVVFALRLRGDQGAPPRILPVLLILAAGVSALLGNSSLPWPEAAREPAQRFLALSIPIFCFFLLSLHAAAGPDRRSHVLAVTVAACITLITLGGVSLRRDHSLFHDWVSPQAFDAERDPGSMADLADRLALNGDERLQFLEHEARAYWAMGNLNEAVRYAMEARSLREDRHLSIDTPPLKGSHPQLWVLAFGCNSPDWFFPKETQISFSFLHDPSVFWYVNRRGRISCLGTDNDVPTPELTDASGDLVRALRSQNGYWAILYASGKMIAGDIDGKDLPKEFRCLTDRGGDVWRDLAAAPRGAWAAISKDGEVRLVNPEADSFENLTPVNESWRNKDIVRRLALLSDGRSGYYVDFYGGIHPFGDTPIQPCHLRGAEEKGKHYFEGRDVMVSLVALDDGRSLVAVDRFGEMHKLSLGADGAVWSGSPGAETAGWNPVVDVEYLPELQRLYLLRENGRIEVAPASCRQDAGDTGG